MLTFKQYLICEAIIYDDTPTRGGRPFSYTRDFLNKDPHTRYETHLSNLYTLQHIQKHSTDTHERIQAGNEMKVAQRKMDFWSKHPDFSQKRAEDIHKAHRDLWQAQGHQPNSPSLSLPTEKDWQAHSEKKSAEKKAATGKRDHIPVRTPEPVRNAASGPTARFSKWRILPKKDT